MFERLLEHGATLPSNLADEGGALHDSLHTMLVYRKACVEQAIHSIRRWHLPLAAIRVMHGYVFRYNWPNVYAQLLDALGDL